MYLERGDGTHHAQVIHLEETVTGQAGEAAGEATGGQQVAMHIKIRQTPRESIKLMLHLKSTEVSQGNLKKR